MPLSEEVAAAADATKRARSRSYRCVGVPLAGPSALLPIWAMGGGGRREGGVWQRLQDGRSSFAAPLWVELAVSIVQVLEAWSLRFPSTSHPASLSMWLMWPIVPSSSALQFVRQCRVAACVPELERSNSANMF